MTSRPGPRDPVAEVALLRRRLERERRARLTAERVGEEATAHLYDTVKQLQEAQAQLQRHADEQELLNELLRELRSDLDTEGILRRTVTAVGGAAAVDRCLVRLADGSRIGPVVEQWTRPGVAPLERSVALPKALEAMCLTAAHQHESLRIDDIFADPRLPPDDARQLQDTLGISSYLGTSMWAGDELIGWLVMHTTGPARSWTPRQVTIINGVARDLGTALLQAHAFQQKEEAVLLLERADHLKNELVSTVSHELRTPLSSIIGYLELLRAGELGDLSERQRLVLTIMSRNTDRLVLLIEDLLLLARADSGASAPSPHQPVLLSPLIDDVWRAVLPLAESGDVDLEMGDAPTEAAVLGHTGDLERVLLNLLSNAIKFTPRGGTVRLSTTATPATVTITVADTGHGIEAEDIPHLYERFYRTTSASERAIQGTGLGLAVVKSLVDQHHGDIDIASTPGHGTTVTLRLPRAASPDVATPLEASTVEPLS